ncbi:hypothetical protein PtrSN002B_005327 [Pyrenophora tritici-repentis]|nr:hypothetical protein PtrV1_05462 [Pyrenophora tritici-repentis]KAF7450206.1 hypothetical protein A1F99_048220 [Pyrenophora tritici-repentis]KAF7572778.1 hypothetical protein PtrM4_076830 [Pyrenophora tritici-repentis]KAG9376173.1 hypothetical protein A1F94_013439 [Pyrenophora tritici-repentis]KAI0583216.1 hypothetical protein Alg130_05794 [Pyrenophora tritici-repentis]
MLALESSVKALSVMALEAKTRVECGAQSSTQDDLKCNLDRALMYAKMAMQDLEKLGEASSAKDAGDEYEQDGKFHIDSLDPFNDCHRY